MVKEYSNKINHTHLQIKQKGITCLLLDLLDYISDQIHVSKSKTSRGKSAEHYYYLSIIYKLTKIMSSYFLKYLLIW